MNAPDSIHLHPAAAATFMNSNPSPTAQVLGIPHLHSQATASGVPITLAQHPLHGIETEVRVSLGHIKMTVAQLLNLRQGQVVSIDHLLDEPVDVMIKDQVVARGVLVAVDDCYGVRITEIPTPLSLGK